MATDAETIALIKSEALAKIREIQGRPAYNVDGQQIDFAPLLAQLWKTVAECNTQLGVEEPFEVITQADSW